jgi:hypothetical protein
MLFATMKFLHAKKIKKGRVSRDKSVHSPSLSKVVLQCACLNHAGVVLAVIRLTKQNVLPHRP